MIANTNLPYFRIYDMRATCDEMNPRLDPNLLNAYDEQGFVVARQLFSPEEASDLLTHFRKLRGSEGRELDYTGEAYKEEFPRMLHMHRWDERSLEWLLSERIADWLRGIGGDEEPYAIQTMVYYKDPGKRGQALHQDQLFVRAQPGISIAAWMALERADEANGCLRVAPGSHKLPLLCASETNTEVSFTDIGSQVPDDLETVAVVMEPGDVLFFHGKLIHGSLPNITKDRSRVSLIGHYVTGDATRVADFYHPVLRMDGTTVELENSPEGGPCGTWVTREGERIVEMS
jgi:phytanoyl-CoA hydroxylase